MSEKLVFVYRQMSDIINSPRKSALGAFYSFEFQYYILEFYHNKLKSGYIKKLVSDQVI